MKVYSSVQIKAMDQATCISRGISSFQLMSEAADACIRTLKENNLIDHQQKLLIVCGVGNNGGDGLMIGHKLIQQEYNVSMMMMDYPDLWSEEVSQAIKLLKEDKIPIQWIRHVTQEVIQVMNQASMILDALIGIGLNRMCDETYIQLIQTMNQSKALRISVDIPSGLNATSGFSQPVAVNADYTLVIGALKQGLVLFDGWDACGKLLMVDIGLVLIDFKHPTFVANKELILQQTPRKHNVHKYNFGHVLVVGGSKTMMGSVSLTCLAALRSGAGLVSLAVLKENQAYTRQLPYEIMTPEYDDELSLNHIINKKTSIVYGMGLSKNKQSEFILPVLLASMAPLVVDADGLTHFKPYLEQGHHNKHLVFTPHLKELSIIANLDMDQVKHNPVQIVQELALRANAIVLCKGPSVILSDGHKTEIIEAGNPGLATAGTGDVLSGIIGTCLSQIDHGFEAVKQAIIIFDAASSMAKSIHGEQGLIASDIVNALPQVFILDENYKTNTR